MPRESNNLRLEEGKIIPLIFDKAAKIMFGTSKNIEITELLASAILNIPIEEIEGKVTLLPPRHQIETLNASELESDLVLLVKTSKGARELIIEFNYFTRDFDNMFNKKRNKKWFNKKIKGKLERNLGYLCKVFGIIKVKEKYINKPPISLINFNSFGNSLEIEDEYELLNKKDIRDSYSKKIKICNINVAKSYMEWYNKKYQERNKYKHNLFILSAMLATNELKEVCELVRELEVKEKLKEKIVEVIKDMNMDTELMGLYYDYKKEQKEMNAEVVEAFKKEIYEEQYNKGIKKGRKLEKDEQQRDIIK